MLAVGDRRQHANEQPEPHGSLPRGSCESPILFSIVSDPTLDRPESHCVCGKSRDRSIPDISEGQSRFSCYTHTLRPNPGLHTTFFQLITIPVHSHGQDRGLWSPRERLLPAQGRDLQDQARRETARASMEQVLGRHAQSKLDLLRAIRCFRFTRS